PAEHRRDPQHREELRRHPLRARIRGFPALGLQPKLRAGHGRELLEWLLELAPFQVSLRCDVPQAERDRALGVLLVDHAETVVLVERQPAQDDRVDNGENRRARADAERQHGKGHDGEGPGSAERAKGIPEVVAHGGLDGASLPGVGVRGSSTPRGGSPRWARFTAAAAGMPLVDCPMWPTSVNWSKLCLNASRKGRCAGLRLRGRLSGATPARKTSSAWLLSSAAGAKRTR